MTLLEHGVDQTIWIIQPLNQCLRNECWWQNRMTTEVGQTLAEYSHYQSDICRYRHSPIESTFATIRHRTRCSKECLNRNGMLCMMFKLAQCAETLWHRLRGFRQLGQVIEGVKFKDGIKANQLCDQVAAWWPQNRHAQELPITPPSCWVRLIRVISSGG